jgi:ubiquinone/menaquinone biosynthesis C-methylase UbiE
MNPYAIYKEAMKDGPVTDLMSGNGLALDYIPGTNDFTFVEIYKPYLDVLKSRLHSSSTAALINMDSVEYLKSLPNKSIPVITCIDGLEHLSKEQGLELLKEIDRVCTKSSWIFTPEGHAEHGGTFNAPHDTWGIPGGDEYQKHLSGWTTNEMLGYGYECIESTHEMPNLYDGTMYTERMYLKRFK